MYSCYLTFEKMYGNERRSLDLWEENVHIITNFDTTCEEVDTNACIHVELPKYSRPIMPIHNPEP